VRYPLNTLRNGYKVKVTAKGQGQPSLFTFLMKTRREVFWLVLGSSSGKILFFNDSQIAGIFPGHNGKKKFIFIFHPLPDGIVWNETRFSEKEFPISNPGIYLGFQQEHKVWHMLPELYV
jgi:hypothetical protein